MVTVNLKNVIWVITASPGKHVTALPITISNINSKKPSENKNVTLEREIKTLVNEKLKPGTYEATFDGSQFPSGAYFYRLQATDFTDTKKLILLK